MGSDGGHGNSTIMYYLSASGLEICDKHGLKSKSTIPRLGMVFLCNLQNVFNYFDKLYYKHKRRSLQLCSIFRRVLIALTSPDQCVVGDRTNNKKRDQDSRDL